MPLRVLLVEPKTRTSYPPLGLMKIATYHKLKGDVVRFVYGTDSSIRDEPWDKIYITSVFTYDLNKLVETIKFYRGNFANMDNVMVGGVSATLLAEKVKEATGLEPHKGLLNEKDDFLTIKAASDKRLQYLQQCGENIDNLPPDYGIFEDINVRYKKILDSSYLFYTTKGCPNKCNFCAVQTLEPEYIQYIPIEPRIRYISDALGEDRAGLLLLDNNVAASDSYFRIIDEIKGCGFGRGEKMSFLKGGRTIYKNRFVDFNQGVDLRLMDIRKMQKMAEIAIKPLRLAFDNISLERRYEEKMRMAIDCGITSLSNYMLYNFKDKPEDLYRRFQVNMRILADYPEAKIYSFPMRYSPIEQTDRKFIGEYWTKREIRAVQLVLNATHGIVSHKNRFFNRAFGRSIECFKKVLLYPYHYLINRDVCEYNNMLLQQWEYDYSQLSPSEAAQFKELISSGIQKEMPVVRNKKISTLLEHYVDEYANILDDQSFFEGRF